MNKKSFKKIKAKAKKIDAMITKKQSSLKRRRLILKVVILVEDNFQVLEIWYPMCA
jgi:ABC-type Zn uptake system ZnuABC Zn-binding protein ZnuA